MTEIIKETTTTQGIDVDTANTVGQKVDQVVVAPVVVSVTNYKTVEYLIYFAFGALEAVLAFRLILKLLGASVSSTFVSSIYSLAGVFIYPFEGIFRKGFAPGVETTSVLEPSTIIAIVVYALLAWGIVKLVTILSRQQQTA